MITDTLQIAIEPTSESRLSSMDWDNLSFGRVFSDHMFYVDYQDGKWQEPKVVPFQNLSFNPASSVLHYGQAIFEGMKAYRGDNDEVLLFRPDSNFRRFNHSARRMCMPELTEALFLESLKTLVDLDRSWVPTTPGSSLYIRPFMIATDQFLGVRPSETYRFMIITSPSGKYYGEPVKVKIETEFARAMVGGTGSAKAAGNYAGSLYPARLAQEQGYHQLIWTDAKTHTTIEEAGTMNVMFVIDGTLVTPPVSSTILQGVTRDSVLKLAREWSIPVEERPISIQEIVEANNRKTLEEAFGVGTAATIAHISSIGYDGLDMTLPPVSSRKISNQLGSFLENLKRGKETDSFGWVVTV